MERPSERVRESRTVDRGRGGDAVVVLTFLSFVASSVLSKLVDGSVRRYDLAGHPYFEVSGNRSGQLAQTLLFIAAATGLLGLLRSQLIRSRINSTHNSPTLGLGAFLAWWLGATIARGELEKPLLNAVLVSVLCLGVAHAPPTTAGIRLLARLGIVTGIASIAFVTLSPELATLPCREDKCGLLGSLATGFFPQENVAAIFFVLLLPSLMLLRKGELALGWSVIALMILCTGGRVASVSLFLATALLVYFRRRRWHEFSAAIPSATLRFVPVAGLVASLIVMYRLSGADLTGRGLLYEAIRAQLHGISLFIGSGPDTLHEAYARGLTADYAAVKEQGQSPHLLVNTGLVGLVLFTRFVVSAMRRTNWDRATRLGLAVALISTTQFITENTWELQARSYSMFALLLVIGLMFRGAPPSQPANILAQRSAP